MQKIPSGQLGRTTNMTHPNPTCSSSMNIGSILAACAKMQSEVFWKKSDNIHTVSTQYSMLAAMALANPPDLQREHGLHVSNASVDDAGKACHCTNNQRRRPLVVHPLNIAWTQRHMEKQNDYDTKHTEPCMSPSISETLGLPFAAAQNFRTSAAPPKMSIFD
eukprot:gene13709-558_t